MQTGTNSIDREKVSHIISEMLFMILGIKVIEIDPKFVDHYIDSILKVEMNTPVKELLLLQKSYLESHAYIIVESEIGKDCSIEEDEEII